MFLMQITYHKRGVKMGKRILVAGAGHGGLAAAADLARRGYDVTVFEQNKREDLGYDWTDIFAPRSLLAANVPYPPRAKYEYKENMTFFSPSQSIGLKQDIPEKELEIKMERKDIYTHLLSHAEKCGVKLRFSCKIKGPVMLGSRVAGLFIDGGETVYGDLVIDAAGLDSPVRTALPPVCGVENDVGSFEQFFSYRAFYERTGDFEPEDKFKVYLLHEGEMGVVWLATEDGHADVLIGRFEPFGMDEVNRVLDLLKRNNPQIGGKLVRGGSFAKIPVRQPLSVMVADGWAAIGDSAFMTIPLIGSGIANSLKASHMLVKTITEDKDSAFTAATLWKYQREYFKQLGNGHAAMAVMKLFLLRLNPYELDFIFEKGILTAKEFTISSETTNIQSMLKLSFKEFLERAKSVCTDRILLTKILKVSSRLASTFAITAMMPRTYNRAAVTKWADTYTSFFTKLEK
ncbi:MAG: NAD(P)/FAD-dependent oxidoreductase [Clostridiales bacterium]|jgi:flavin-dependent dehydrogenase|nr:NAD(P)/FAD-dependent oxidoreductase [Clostridiales bacterium]